MKNNFRKIVIIVLMMGGMLGGKDILAFYQEALPNVSVEKDFVLMPAKVEMALEAGETITKELTIINRLGKTTDFKVELEDFQGSQEKEMPTVLLGEKKGPYSLKDYLRPEVFEFTLNHGERISLPIEISVPSGMEPGGLYGSVIISTSAPPGDGSGADLNNEAQIRAIGRIACLFFVRVRGQSEEIGFLKQFNTSNGKKIYQKTPVAFTVSYQNDGNVHLDPYGFIEIKDILGRKVSQIKIEPYFSMPQSLRYVEPSLKNHLSPGFYSATLFLNRGYQDIIDTAKINFYILPLRAVFAWVFFALAMIFLVWLIAAKKKFRKRSLG